MPAPKPEDVSAPAPNLLAHFLAETDIPCPGCGYNLRGLTSPTCPECRQELTLRVQLAESNVGALIATVAPLIAVAGAAACLVLFVVVISTVEGDVPPGRWFVFLVLTPAIAAALLGAPAIYLASPRGRRWHRARTAAGRRRALIAAWIVAWLTLAAYIAYAIEFIS